VSWPNPLRQGSALHLIGGQFALLLFMSMGRWPLKYDASFDLGIAIILIIVIGLAIYSWSKEQTKPADSGAE
jgi:hypothetical protein